MIKVSLAKVPAVRDPHPDLSGVSVKSLINRASVGSNRGMLSVAEFDPGGSHKLHRHASAAQISYLLSGEGEHLTANGPVALKAGDAVLAQKNEWHGFRNTGDEPAVLVSLYSPAADPSEPGYESYEGEIGGSRRPEVRKVSLSDLQGDAALDEDAGFIGLGVFWLATKDTVGAESSCSAPARLSRAAFTSTIVTPTATSFCSSWRAEGSTSRPTERFRSPRARSPISPPTNFMDSRIRKAC